MLPSRGCLHKLSPIAAPHFGVKATIMPTLTWLIYSLFLKLFQPSFIQAQLLSPDN